jgi:hypothetical protein
MRVVIKQGIFGKFKNYSKISYVSPLNRNIIVGGFATAPWIFLELQSHSDDTVNGPRVGS